MSADHVDDSADDVGIGAIAAAPEVFADDNNFGAVGEIFFASERATEKGRDAEDAKESIGNISGWDALGIQAVATNGGEAFVIESDVIEKARARAHVEIIREGD